VEEPEEAAVVVVDVLPFRKKKTQALKSSAETQITENSIACPILLPSVPQLFTGNPSLHPHNFLWKFRLVIHN
jgi:hypothetical protein